jgi:predicted PurR-regulated permease PerM
MKVNRIASVILAALLAIAVLLAIGVVIGTQLAHLISQLPEYVATIQSKIGAIGNYATDHFPGVLKRLGLALGDGDSMAGPAAASPLPGAEPDVPHAALSPMTVLTTTCSLSCRLSPVATAGIVFVVAVFILLKKEELRDRMIRLFGSSDLHRTTGAMDDAARRLSRYFLTLLTINVGFGIVIGTGLFLIGVPSPVLWGILGIVLRFVPYVGPILAATLPIALSAAVDPGWSMVVWTAALFVVTELTFNQVIEPAAYGQSTGLSPFSVIVAALFWGWLWGPIGLILSMPLTLCLVVLGRHVERLEFLDVLPGDRPALSRPKASTSVCWRETRTRPRPCRGAAAGKIPVLLLRRDRAERSATGCRRSPTWRSAAGPAGEGKRHCSQADRLARLLRRRGTDGRGCPAR